MPCTVLPGNFGKIVQGSLALLTMATLSYKWKTDTSGRNRLMFMMDTFKNCSGAASLHFANILFARVLAPVLEGADECHWYFIEIMIDTTLGVYVEFLLLMQIIGGLQYCACTAMAQDLSQHAGGGDSEQPEIPSQGVCSASAQLTSDQDAPSSQGNFSDINFVKYFKQVFMWLFVVLMMKGVMVLIMLIMAPQLIATANFLLSPVDANPNVELLLVMMVTPAIMNSLQFWLQDNIFVNIASKHDEHGETSEIPDQINFSLQRQISKQEKDHALTMVEMKQRVTDLEADNRQLKADLARTRWSIARQSYGQSIVTPVVGQILGSQQPTYRRTQTDVLPMASGMTTAEVGNRRDDTS